MLQSHHKKFSDAILFSSFKPVSNYDNALIYASKQASIASNAEMILLFQY